LIQIKNAAIGPANMAVMTIYPVGAPIELRRGTHYGTTLEPMGKWRCAQPFAERLHAAGVAGIGVGRSDLLGDGGQQRRSGARHQPKFQ
jgi:hypothetical protein